MKLVSIFATAALTMLGVSSRSLAEGFPQGISFSWYQNGATYQGTGPLGGYSASSSYRPFYNLKIRVGNENRDGVLALNWSWPNHIDFSLSYRGSVCPGSADLQGSKFVGSMTCPGGTHPVTIY